MCVADPCAAVECDEQTEFCSEGRCVKLCAHVFCDPGERCAIIEGTAGKETRCIKDSCLEVNCPTDQVCIEGRCVEDPCARAFCKKHEVCIDGVCQPDPCEQTRCPAGYVCNLGVCQAQNVSGATELLASGGGGFSCRVSAGADVGGHTSLVLLLLGWVMLFVRRRRTSRPQRRRQ